MDIIKSGFKFIQKRGYFIDGLLVSIAIFLWVYYAFAPKYLSRHIVNVLKLLGANISNEAYSAYFVVGSCIGVIGIIILWSCFRRPYVFKEGVLGVFFAPNFDQTADVDVERIYASLKIELKSHELGNKFDVKKLPSNIEVSSHEEAVRVLKKCNAMVIVWGIINQQTGLIANATGFSPIKFTFRHQPLRLSRLWLQRLTSPLITRKWRVESNNVLIDQQMLARHISFVVRDMIGLAFLLSDNYAEAIKVFSKLHVDIATLTSREKGARVGRFLTDVRRDLSALITKQVSAEYYEHLFKSKLFAILPATLNKWLLTLENALKINPDNADTHSNKAIFLFLIGDMRLSIRAAQKTKKLTRKASAAPYFSLAFLYNFQADYDLSRRAYAAGMSLDSSYDEALVKQCLFFIRQTIERYPEKKQLHLALATLEFHRGNRDIAVEGLNKFLEEAGSIQELSEFVKEARRLLSEANRNE